MAKFTIVRSVKYAFGAKKKFSDTILVRRSSCTFVPSFKQFHQERKNLLLNLPVEILFLWKKGRKFTLFWSVKYSPMGLWVWKLGRIVDLSTPHLHAKYEIFSSFISQNIPVEMLLLWKNGLKYILFWSVKYTSIELWTWNLACLCTLLPNR